MDAVILRPSYFMEVWLSPVLGFDTAHGTARIYGSGESKVSYISASNVVQFGVAALTRETGRKTILEMGGPDPLSQLDAVHLFEETLQKKLKLEFVPIEALRGQHRSTDPLQKTFAALMLGYAQGDIVREARANADRFAILLRTLAE